MKKTAADGLVMTALKMEPALSREIETVAGKSGQSASATMRAAIRLGLRALLETPTAVRMIEAGALNEVPKEEYARLYRQLLRLDQDAQSGDKPFDMGRLLFPGGEDTMTEIAKRVFKEEYAKLQAAASVPAKKKQPKK